MRHSQLLGLMLLLWPAAACRREARRAAPEPDIPVAEMKQGLEDARRRLEGLQTDIRRLESRAIAASREARRDTRRSLEELKERELLARIKIEELQVAARKNWRAARAGARSALDDLETATRWTEQRLRRLSGDRSR